MKKPTDETFTSRHPLADVVLRLHRAHGGSVGSGIGRVGCGACWERAIRDDERMAIEYGLPRDLTPDPDYMDEIAIQLACQGWRPRLTVTERAEAIKRLQAREFTQDKIARILGIAHGDVAAGGRRRSPIPHRSHHKKMEHTHGT